MDVYYMYTETDSRTVFFVFCIRIVNITRRSTLYIARSPGCILNIRDGFHPVARIYANIIVVFPRTIQFCDVILCCIATRRGAEVVEFSRGMNVFLEKWRGLVQATSRSCMYTYTGTFGAWNSFSPY